MSSFGGGMGGRQGGQTQQQPPPKQQQQQRGGKGSRAGNTAPPASSGNTAAAATAAQTTGPPPTTAAPTQPNQPSSGQGAMGLGGRQGGMGATQPPPDTSWATNRGRMDPNAKTEAGYVERNPQQQPEPQEAQPAGPGQDDPFGMGEIRDMWGDILGQSEQGLQDDLLSVDADESRNARRASEMNASMGGSVGGGFHGGQTQAQLGGALTRASTRSQHRQQQLEMKSAFLGQMMGMADRAEDRELQSELQAEMDKTQIEIAKAGNTTQLTIAADQRDLGYAQLDAANMGPEANTEDPDSADNGVYDPETPPAGITPPSNKPPVRGVSGEEMPADYGEWTATQWQDFLTNSTEPGKFGGGQPYGPNYNVGADIDEISTYLDRLSSEPGSLTAEERDNLTRFMLQQRAIEGHLANDGQVREELLRLRGN